MNIKRFWPSFFASFTIVLFLVLAASAIQAQVWTASITVENFDPMRPETKNVSFGVNPDATDGIDPGLDVIAELPPVPSPGQPYLNVGFAGPGLTYFSTDIRPAGPWWLIVGSSDKFTISWDISAVPADIPLFLNPGDGSPIINMREKNSQDFIADIYVMTIAEIEWTASISVENFDPIRPQTKNVNFGVHPDATDGIDDGLDVIAELPPVPSPGQPYLNVGFAGPGLTYFSTDIRPAGPWWLIVGSSDKFTISWDISAVPADISLVMDSSDGRTIDMRSITSVDFPEKGGYSMIIKEGKYGDLSGNKEITPFDASLVLQYIVGLINLLPEQKIAADVTGDKTVSALDAALILQYTVGLITQFPIEPITGAPALVIKQLETVSLNREQKQVLERLKHLFLNQLSPTQTALLQNYPNPFNPETWIPFELAKEAEVVINIYNIKGELVRTLSIGRQPAGCYLSKEKAVFWNGKNQSGEAVANGLYFYAFKAGEFQATRKMILVK